MKLSQIYELAIDLGKEVDIRGKDQDIDYFPDSKIINFKDIDANSVFVGIDIDVGELLLIDKLKDKGLEIDAAISHHPISKAAYLMAEVAKIQKHNWVRYGVEEKTAEKLVKKIIWESQMEAKAKNNLRAESVSRYLDIPLICVHTAIDNLTQAYFEQVVGSNKSLTLGELFKIISGIEECQMAKENGDGPFMVDESLKEKNVGKYMVDMTGGLDPPTEIFSHLKGKVDTVIGMHYSVDNIKAVKEKKIGAIIAGHMASDSIGLNIYCDKLEEEGIRIYPGSGFYRVKRD